MDQFYQSSLYLHMVRSPKKSMQHCCTGETEIERIAKNISFHDLEYCLSHSKMLHNFIEKNPLDKKLDGQAFQELCHIKNITNQQNKFYVRKVLDEFHCYKFSLKVIDQNRQLKYNKNNEFHQKLLLQLWSNLMPKQQLTNRISNQWITVGFQANDPATDFRGAGFLGLLNLVNWSRNKKCRGAFEWAINEDTSYFFCSAGLFFTMTAAELAKQMLIPVQFWLHEDQTQILSKFQLVYNMLFMQFDHFWKSVQNKSILEFNNNLTKFKALIKSKSPQTLKERIIYWEEV